MTGTAGAAVEVTGLRTVDGAGRAVLDGVTLRVAAGERVALLGPSGSGKTTLALTLLGAVRPGLHVTGGRVTVGGHDMLAAGGTALRHLRRTVVGYLPQNPAQTLTPTLRVAAQLDELARDGRDPAARLHEVGLPADPGFLRRFPHQLSGGQQQRVALVRALSAQPRLLVLDEPTSGLDAAAADATLRAVDAAVTARGLTLLVITHDPDVARRLAGRTLVLDRGRLREPHRGEHGAAPPPRTGGPDGAGRAAGARAGLEAVGLSAAHGTRGVAEGLSLRLEPGECVALLGPSGTGKTTVARCLAGLHRPVAGRLLLDGRHLPFPLRERPAPLRHLVQLVPQDAAGALNPHRTVEATLTRPLRRLAGLGREDARQEAARLLDLLQLPAAVARRTTGRLSGGQQQRVALARALCARPAVLLCDEATSQLDRATARAVHTRLARLGEQQGLSVLMITHDPALVAGYADRTVALDGMPAPDRRH
ncbi:ABC transporter ATP-binding protein [Actinacidiphila epipremni]|uniref:ABC transporter ATP-binding protein n=1 Tax=Actinacidiphila epipremni TaxID=2053013 RepID=A0ABX0ZL63_9ACTN|nr:ATP-binding cassette domain-containing protein [Actinacidiphila epipremni]NJP43552.1 ABC transporter ATP-binding protein [Actinacidiphila epipremni]